MDIRAFVINLDRRPERLSIQSAQLDRLGIPWERIAAVDASTIGDQEYRRRRFHWERCLQYPEMGCFLSHQVAWQRIISLQAPGLVLEDDSILSENAATVLREFPFSELAACYNLEAGHARKTISKTAIGEPIEGHRAFQVYYDRGGSGAYVMTPQAAKIALELSQRCTAPADAFLNNLPGVARYQFEPTLALQLVYCQFTGESVTKLAAASNIVRCQDRLNLLESLQYQPRMKFRRLKSYCQRTLNKLRSLPNSDTRLIRFCPTIRTIH